MMGCLFDKSKKEECDEYSLLDENTLLGMVESNKVVFMPLCSQCEERVFEKSILVVDRVDDKRGVFHLLISTEMDMEEALRLVSIPVCVCCQDSFTTNMITIMEFGTEERGGQFISENPDLFGDGNTKKYGQAFFQEGS